MNADKSRLGETLVASGLLSKDQLSSALRLVERLGCELAEAVDYLGYASEESVLRAFSKELNVAYASISNRLLCGEADKDLMEAVPEPFAREHRAFPLFLDGKTLAVAFAGLEHSFPERLLTASGYRVVAFLASRRQLAEAIDRVYRLKPPPAAPRVAADPVRDRAVPLIDLDSPVREAGGGEAIVRLNGILRQAILERCSDIHIELHRDKPCLRFRIDGVLHDRPAPGPELFSEIVSRIKVLARLNIAEKRLPQDGNFSVSVRGGLIDIRASICPMGGGEKAVLRVLGREAADLDVEKIGFEGRQKADFLAAAKRPNGLIFLTGPTGSGKTTTLYSVLNSIFTLERNFMTVEDPIEITLPRINQAQVRPDIGLTFSALLRSFLRQDPDVVLVGEVRDRETAHVCVTAALTGRLVFSTLHTNDALGAVLRLIDLGVEPFLLANSLVLVAAQRLVRRLCPQCKKPYKPSRSEFEACLRQGMVEAPAHDAERTVLYQAAGCKRCANTGFLGRTAILEVYPIEGALREAIYSHKTDMAHLRRAAAASGTLNLRAAGFRKVLQGVTTSEEILGVTAGE